MTVQGGECADQFLDRDVRQQGTGLQHGADPPGPDRGGRVRPEHGDRSGVGRGQTEDQVDRGRLAGSVGTEYGDHLTRRDGQVDPADGLNSAERLVAAR